MNSALYDYVVTMPRWNDCGNSLTTKGNMTNVPSPIGPLRPNFDPAEQQDRLRSLPALAIIFGGPDHRLVLALARNECGLIDDTAASEASKELDNLLFVQRRRVLNSLHTVLRIINATT